MKESVIDYFAQLIYKIKFNNILKKFKQSYIS